MAVAAARIDFRSDTEECPITTEKAQSATKTES